MLRQIRLQHIQQEGCCLTNEIPLQNEKTPNKNISPNKSYPSFHMYNENRKCQQTEYIKRTRIFIKSNLKEQISNGIVVNRATSLHLRHHQSKINSPLQPRLLQLFQDQTIYKEHNTYEKNYCEEKNVTRIYSRRLHIPGRLSAKLFVEETYNQVYTQPVIMKNRNGTIHQ